MHDCHDISRLVYIHMHSIALLCRALLTFFLVFSGVSSCEHSINTLRYADRVKELVVGDLPSNSGEDDDYDKQDTQDLLQLQSLNEIDMTPEMLNFHQVISDLQLAEENMVESHKLIVDQMYSTAEKAERILQMTDKVTYDQEGNYYITISYFYHQYLIFLLAYCKSMEDLFDSLMSSMHNYKDLVADFKSKLAAEEQLSRKTKRK